MSEKGKENGRQHEVGLNKINYKKKKQSMPLP